MELGWYTGPADKKATSREKLSPYPRDTHNLAEFADGSIYRVIIAAKISLGNYYEAGNTLTNRSNGVAQPVPGSVPPTEIRNGGKEKAKTGWNRD